MQIKRAGSQPSGKGPADYFTGTVRVDPLPISCIALLARSAWPTPAPSRRRSSFRRRSADFALLKQ